MSDKDNLYVQGSKLNKAFFEIFKDYHNVEELTGLGCSLADLESSFNKILEVIYSKLQSTDPNDYDKLHEIFMDLWMEFKHINYHIEQAEPELLTLTNYLAEKSEAR